MSTDTTILTVSLVWLAAVVSPGPNFLIVSRLALAQSRRASLGASIGIAVASFAYAVLTMFGLNLLILRLSWLGEFVALSGGIYLAWLGLRSWLGAKANPSMSCVMLPAENAQFLAGVRIGFLCELTNPKAIAFFLGLFAAMIPFDTPLWAKITILSLGLVTELAWYAAIGSVLSTERLRAGYRRVKAWLDRMLGALLIAAGVRIAIGALQRIR
ncbi:MAG TPA: LysE family transporter [Stellaceae bacterium]|nr:LysE family transporter [Stellaceae bacterium]